MFFKNEISLKIYFLAYNLYNKMKFILKIKKNKYILGNL